MIVTHELQHLQAFQKTDTPFLQWHQAVPSTLDPDLSGNLLGGFLVRRGAV